MRDWDWGESNSLYGLDENGNKIPMRGGTECAKELRALLASHWPAHPPKTETPGSGRMKKLYIAIVLLAVIVFALWHYGRMLKWCC